MTTYRHDFWHAPDGAHLYYEVSGQPTGVPAILCDGLGCDGFAWRYLKPELALTRPVIHWHYRGHGLSRLPLTVEEYAIERFADDLAGLLDHLEVKSGVVFGHSMGVQVALEFARRHSQRVAGLVLLNGGYGHPLDTWHDGSALRIAFPKIRKLVEKFPSMARRLVTPLMSTELPIHIGLRFELNPLLAKREDLVPYFDHLARMDPLAFVRTLGALQEHTAWDHLPDIRVPTFIVGGERDTYSPGWISRRMADRIPTSELMMVADGSHVTPLERPREVNARVLDFIRQRV